MNTNDKVKALAVLGLIGSIANDCQFTTSKKVKDQAKKISRWQVDCVECLCGTSISGKMKRQLDMYSKRMVIARNEFFNSDRTNEKTITQEAIAADGMLDWLKRSHNLKGNCWFRLAQTLETLVNIFRNTFPEHEDWSLYEKLDDIVRV